VQGSGDAQNRCAALRRCERARVERTYSGVARVAGADGRQAHSGALRESRRNEKHNVTNLLSSRSIYTAIVDGVVRIAAAGSLRHLRIRTEGSRAQHPGGDIAVSVVLRGDDTRRRDAVFDPMLERL